MIPEEYTAGKAALNELRTKSNELAEQVRSGNEGAREINARVRVLMQEQRGIDAQANALQKALKQHEIEEAARKAAEAKAEREATEKARLEAEAAEASKADEQETEAAG